MKFTFWRRAKRSDELNEEIQAHLTLAERDAMEDGHSRHHAQISARHEFGNVAIAAEVTRDTWGWRWLADLWDDVRYGVRMLGKNPGFTAVAVITLALGIGANSTIFSWINSTLLNPIPALKNADDFSAIFAGPASNPSSFSYPDYVDLRDHNQSFSGLLAYSLSSVNLTGEGKPARAWGMLVSANYFEVLGVHPIFGRGFLPSEDTTSGGAPVAVIGYQLWQTRYGSDASLIGKTIAINRHPFTVIGITPPLFQGTQSGLRADLWVPLAMQPQVTSYPDALSDRSANWLFGLGRLKPGVGQVQAQAEISLLYKQIAQQFPRSHKGEMQMTLHPLWRAPFSSNYYLHTILFLLMAIASVVLLLACANVANLLLVRSIGRRREIAIRLSMGATRWRLVRQLLVESLIFSLCGGTVAILFTFWTANSLPSFIPPTSLPISMNILVDRSVLLATLAISLITGVVFGILPALRSSNVQPVAVLKEDTGGIAGGRHKARLSSALVIAQIALSVLLLVSAGLFIRSFQNAQIFNPGFNPVHVTLASFDLAGSGRTAAQGAEFDRQVLAKVAALPGVQSAALATWVPFGFYTNSTDVLAEGYVAKPHESLTIEYAHVSPNYLKTMEIPLAAGREFQLQDSEKSQPVAIVNQKFAEIYWPRQDAIGKRIRVEGYWRTVVGVARTTNYDDLGEQPKPFVYFPLLQDYSSAVVLHVRVVDDALAFVPAAEKAIHELDADLPIFDVGTLETRINLITTNQRLAGTFVGAFGILALILASVGTYGVLAYTTRQRTHEIGVRMALGAKPMDALWLVLRQGAKLVIGGVAIGLLASLALTRALSSELFGVTATDPKTFGGVAILLTIIALAACYIPARRAMATDPMVALRHE